MSDSEIIFYSAEPDAERLSATTISEAVEQYVDRWDDPPAPDDEVEVTSYRRMELPSRDRIAAVALDAVLEWLDEEHGDPDGDSVADHEAGVLHDHSLSFADAVRSNYVTWACEPVETFTVKVSDHVPDEWIVTEDA